MIQRFWRWLRYQWCEWIYGIHVGYIEQAAKGGFKILYCVRCDHRIQKGDIHGPFE